MTTREIADALGVSRELVLKRANELFPGRVVNGKTTEYNEQEATLIRMRIAENSSIATSDDRTRLANMPKTDLQMEAMTLEVMQWQTAKIKSLQEQLIEAAPKIESYEALQRSNLNMSITDAAKHFGLHPKTEVFPYLRACGYLTKKDLPTQYAIDTDILALKESNCDGIFRAQAVVDKKHLERFYKSFTSYFI